MTMRKTKFKPVKDACFDVVVLAPYRTEKVSRGSISKFAPATFERMMDCLLGGYKRWAILDVAELERHRRPTSGNMKMSGAALTTTAPWASALIQPMKANPTLLLPTCPTCHRSCGVMTSLEGGPRTRGDDNLGSTASVSVDGHPPLFPPSSSTTPDRHASELQPPLSVDACVGAALIGSPSLTAAVVAGSAMDPLISAHLTSTAMQVFVPFILAGVGSTIAGILLDVVKANLGNLNRVREQLPMIFANIALLQCQSTVATLVACTLAIFKSVAIDNYWDPSHVAILFAGALAAVNTASLLLSLVMSAVVVVSTKCDKNPDNIAPAIAASFGDLTTLFLLSGYSSFLLYRPYLAPLVIVLCVGVLPVWIILARRNSVSRVVLRVGWLPIIVALTVSSFGGYILDYAVITYPPIALHLSSVNALGGNLAAVFSCSLSSYLNRLTVLGRLPAEEPLCVGPLQMYYQGGDMANVAYVLVGVVVPGQTLFAVLSRVLRFGRISMSITFFAAYIGASLAQVVVLLYLARLVVYRLWGWSIDPDNAAIPCLTGCGDFLGTGFLTLAYVVLHYVGDESAVQEEELRTLSQTSTLLTPGPYSSSPNYGNTTIS
ncbi:solute carrier family 41 member 1-like isoform X2 [Dermacentor variabilis]|uniref:solute carrier family 41 member 1-like isoform X2 n=1 Tax=Dermacentor variabilis TaxID=34621 RepID=UPI003F5C45C2